MEKNGLTGGTEWSRVYSTGTAQVPGGEQDVLEFPAVHSPEHIPITDFPDRCGKGRSVGMGRTVELHMPRMQHNCRITLPPGGSSLRHSNYYAAGYLVVNGNSGPSGNSRIGPSTTM